MKIQMAAMLAASMLLLGLGVTFAQAPATNNAHEFGEEELRAGGFPAPAGRALEEGDSLEKWCIVVESGDTLDGLTAGQYSTRDNVCLYFRDMNPWLRLILAEELPVGRRLCGFAKKADLVAAAEDEPARAGLRKSVPANPEAAIGALVLSMTDAERQVFRYRALADNLEAIIILVGLAAMIFGYLQRRAFKRAWEDAQVRHQAVVEALHESYKARLSDMEAAHENEIGSLQDANDSARKDRAVALRTIRVLTRASAQQGQFAVAALERLLQLAIAPPVPIPAAADWMEGGAVSSEPVQLDLLISTEPAATPADVQTDGPEGEDTSFAEPPEAPTATAAQTE